LLYYEELQDRVIEWDASHRDAWTQYTEAYSRYMSPRAPSVDESIESWSNIHARLTVPWDVLAQDNEFMNSIFFRQAIGQLYERYLEEALAGNVELRSALLARADSD
jgi:hypothetical protein